jgi:hypothetical protein
VSTFGVQRWKSCVFEGFTHERREEVWGERIISTSLHRTVPHPREVWNCGLQAWLVTILSWSSWHLPRVTTEEMFVRTCGRRVAENDTARGWPVVPRAPNEGLGSEGSCHEAQNNQVLQYTMGQSLWRRSKLRKRGFSSFSASRLWTTVERERAIVRCPLRTFSPFKSRDEILF